MRSILRTARGGGIAVALVLLSACGNTGGLGSILGSVLGGVGGQGQGSNNELTGTFVGVDTRSQQLSVQQSNGQQVTLVYDNNTQVIYNNQRFAVTNLERGDIVSVAVQQTQNNAYYASTITVTQSASNGSANNGSVQSFQGTVQQVDQQNGLFSINSGSGRVVVQLAQQLSRNDYQRFQNLRIGDNVRFYGVNVGQQRVELRQFY